MSKINTCFQIKNLWWRIHNGGRIFSSLFECKISLNIYVQFTYKLVKSKFMPHDACALIITTLYLNKSLQINLN